jgi:hypothetical protein
VRRHILRSIGELKDEAYPSFSSEGASTRRFSQGMDALLTSIPHGDIAGEMAAAFNSE